MYLKSGNYFGLVATILVDRNLSCLVSLLTDKLIKYDQLKGNFVTQFLAKTNQIKGKERKAK